MSTIYPPSGFSRRALVVDDAPAGHPFRAALMRQPRRRIARLLGSAKGWRDFLSAYASMFAAVLVFIA